MFNFSCDILCPFEGCIILKHPGPLYEFVGADKKVYPFDGELEDKGCKKAYGDRVYPHVNGVADKAEAGFASCAENAGYQHRIHRSACNIHRIDHKHELKIIFCHFADFGDIKRQRADGCHYNTSRNSRIHGQSQKNTTGFFALFHATGAQYLPHHDSTACRKAKAQHRSKVSNGGYQGIGSHNVVAEMAVYY